MEFLYLLLTLAVCYFVTDRGLRAIEKSRGHLLPHREIIFFLVLLSLLLVATALIRNFVT